jgi:uncharacterized protein (DUF4415 family)
MKKKSDSRSEASPRSRASTEVDFTPGRLLTAEDLKLIKRRLTRGIKLPVTMRLDEEIVDWLKEDGPGYQTRANEILRTAMERAMGLKPGRWKR